MEVPPPVGMSSALTFAPELVDSGVVVWRHTDLAYPAGASRSRQLAYATGASHGGLVDLRRRPCRLDEADFSDEFERIEELSRGLIYIREANLFAEGGSNHTRRSV